jgi:pimeloyl-ACP methyl ester carboxylesterase
LLSFTDYLELEDERKNPSWKRRAHRFCSGIDVDKVVELNCALQIALLSYADTVDEIRAGLEIHTIPHELVYAEARSEPGQPAHFIAIKRDQSSTSPTLEVLMGVRGTKTVADAITDILCDVEDYKGGKAHSFILASGKFLVEKHTKLLEELLTKSGKSKVKLTLIGHSLGAGVASIAGLEFKDNPKFEVEVLGFGCPALLSKELAEKADCITTVINDSDMVPRMSGIAIANLLLNVMEFDWLTYAQRDVDFAVEELQARQGFIFNDIVVAKIRELVDPMLDDFADHTIKTELTEKVVPELYPPGKCIHFYRDGSGISGNFVPSTYRCLAYQSPSKQPYTQSSSYSLDRFLRQTHSLAKLTLLVE